MRREGTVTKYSALGPDQALFGPKQSPLLTRFLRLGHFLSPRREKNACMRFADCETGFTPW